MAKGTVHGFSITLGTQGGTYDLTNVGNFSSTREAVKATHHGTTGFHEYIPADLTDSDEIEVTYQFNGTQSPLVNSAVAETITFTCPLQTGESTAAKVAGTGFITKCGINGGAAGAAEMATATLTIRFDGYTGPAFTAAT